MTSGGLLAGILLSLALLALKVIARSVPPLIMAMAGIASSKSGGIGVEAGFLVERNGLFAVLRAENVATVPAVMPTTEQIEIYIALWRVTVCRLFVLLMQS